MRLRLALVLLALSLGTPAGAAGRSSARHRKQESIMLDKGLELIKKGDARSICEGAALLEKQKGAPAILALLPHLGSRVEQVRECVRQALDRMDVAPVLLGWWRDADGEKRRQALDAAVGLSHGGLMELYREASASQDAAVRRQAATGLKRQQGAEALRLLGGLLADADKDVRWWAIDSLGVLGSKEAKELLRARLGTEGDASLRKFIEKALR